MRLRCDDPLAAIEILKTLPQIDTLLVNRRGHNLEKRAVLLQRYADSWQNTTHSLLVNGYTAEKPSRCAVSALHPEVSLRFAGADTAAVISTGPSGREKVTAVCDLLRA